MSIKIKEEINISDRGFDLSSVKVQMKQLLPGDYAVYVCDKTKPRSFSQNKYLFGVVLKMIAEETGNEAKDLYKVFEEKFAPIKVIEFQGEEKIVRDMKRCSSKEMGLIIERIIRYADKYFNIRIPTQDELRTPEAEQIYVDAYNDAWNEGFA